MPSAKNLLHLFRIANKNGNFLIIKIIRAIILKHFSFCTFNEIIILFYITWIDLKKKGRNPKKKNVRKVYAT